MVSFHHLYQTSGQVTSTLTAGLWSRPAGTITGDIGFVVQDGDSGGPLFTKRPDGSRDVFGITQGFQDNSNNQLVNSGVWVDITTSDAKAWIVANASDPNRRQSTNPTWYAQHPLPQGQPEWWLGDVEYTGLCNVSNDADCDHWTDEHDNCPFAFNPDQADNDDNGVGDVCEPCPCDPSNDPDKDRKCTSCQGINARCQAACASATAFDNCPEAYNPGQENCNVEAETAAGQRIGTVSTLGDVCDPVPCPQGSTNTAVPASPICCPNPNNQGQQCLLGKVFSTIEITPIGSHPLNNVVTKAQALAGLDNGLLLGGTIVAGRPTGAHAELRYCQSAPPNVQCHATAVLNPNQLNFWVDAASEQGTDASHPWHRVTTSPPGGSCGTRGASVAVGTYGGASTNVTWCFQSDLQAWLGATTPVIPTSAAACQGTTPLSCSTNNPVAASTCLSGAMWLHASDADGIGAIGFTDDIGTGIHTSAQEIADNYFDVNPVQNVTYCPVPTRITNIQGLTLTRPQAIRPALLWPDLGTNRNFDLRVHPETEVLVINSSVGIAALEDDGSGVAVAPTGTACSGQAVSAGLAGRLGMNLDWASTVEPRDRIGIVDRNVVAVGLCADGTAICDEALIQNGVAHALTEIEDTNSDGNLVFSSAIAPSSRQNFVSVFSRAAGGVFLLGGTDPQSGATLHDVWFVGRSGQWSKLRYGAFALGQVLAATYSFGDQQLWVLDRIVGPLGVHQVRLTRLAGDGGHAQMVAEWLDLKPSETWYLSVDRDGGILLTGSDAVSNTTVRFSIAGPCPVAVAAVKLSGALALRPVVDPFSYAFVYWQSSTQLAIARRPTLTSHPIVPGLPVLEIGSLVVPLCTDLAAVF